MRCNILEQMAVLQLSLFLSNILLAKDKALVVELHCYKIASSTTAAKHFGIVHSFNILSSGNNKNMSANLQMRGIATSFCY